MLAVIPSTRLPRPTIRAVGMSMMCSSAAGAHEDPGQKLAKPRSRCPTGGSGHLWSGVGELLAGLSVDGFAEEVGVAVMPRVLLDHVEHDPAKAGCPSVWPGSDR